MELEKIKETFLYKDILQNCAQHPELISDLVIELHIAYEANPVDFYWDEHLGYAFTWGASPQGERFWYCIDNGWLPERYK